MKCKNEDTVEIRINDMKIRKNKKNVPCKSVIDTIIDFDLDRKNNSCGIATRDSYVSLLMTFAKELRKPFSDASKRDIDLFLGRRNGSTLERYKMNIKKFFNWFGKPELVNHLEYHKQPETLTPQMMWTEDEILQLIKVVDPATKERDQAIIMMMFDLAAEKSVIEKIKIKDISDEEGIIRAIFSTIFGLIISIVTREIVSELSGNEI